MSERKWLLGHVGFGPRVQMTYGVDLGLAHPRTIGAEELTRLRAIEEKARAVTNSHQALDTPAFLKALEELRRALGGDVS